jgi:hypothetical protein
VQKGLEPLFEILGAELDPSWRSELVTVAENHLRVMRTRVSKPVGFTLVHGDVNPGNILAPHEGHRPIYLVDRQPFDWSLQCWLGTSDLAYMMVLHWEVEQRRQWQEQVLLRYQAALAERGIAYDREQLLWDYRFSVIEALEYAVEWLVVPADRTAKRWIWEPQLKKSMAAYFDLQCGELWR